MPRRKVSEEYNLKALFPKLINDWDEQRNVSIGLQMDSVSPFSDKKAHWRCGSCGHQWEARIANRSRLNSGCPACSSIGKAVNKTNSLAARYPEIARTWHPTLNGSLTPEDVRYGSKEVVYWQCLDHPEHVFKQGIGKRTSWGKATCMICTGRIATDQNALATTHPELLKEWDWTENILDPYRVTAGSTKKAHWICPRFPDIHRWSAVIKNRTRGAGCRYCNNQGSIPEVRIFCELETLFSDIKYRARISSIEVDVFIPSLNLAIEYDGSHWHAAKDEKDREKNNALKAIGLETLRVRHQPLAPIGDNDVIVQKPTLTKSDLNETVRAIFSLDNRLSPDFANSYLEKETFQAETEFKQMTSLLPGIHLKNNAALLAPQLLNIYSSKNPLPLSSYSFGSGKKAIWECTKGHPDYEATIKNKVLGRDCPYCTGKLVAAEDSLATRFPELASEWDTEKNGFGPDEISYGSSAKKHWWKCNRFGHSFKATVNNRTTGSSCPLCPKPGNSLAEVAPELEAQWLTEQNDGLQMAEIPAGRKTRYWWRCAANPLHPHFMASPANMRRAVSTASKGCNICRRRGPLSPD